MPTAPTFEPVQQKIPTGEKKAPAETLRILIVEDSDLDTQLLLRELRRGGYDPQYERVETRDEMRAALECAQWDIIVSDHAMPRFSAPAALALMKEFDLDLPFIIVSGHIGEDIAVAAMKSGAHDYLMKEKLARLVPAIERELREADVRRARRKAEADLRRSHAELEIRVEKRTAELTAANAKLQNLIAERKRLEQELLEITEKERRRIGLDLHDDLGQKLAGLALMTKGLELKLAQKKMPEAKEAARIQELVDEAVNHTSGLARELSTLDLRCGDLAEALKGLAVQVKNLFSVTCQFKSEGDIPRLDPTAVRHLYKIAQEAVTNAIKHGKARQVVIHLNADRRQLALNIRNNGAPFPAVIAKSSGMGLRIMNYRASVIDARLDVRADGDCGTIVTCVLSRK